MPSIGSITNMHNIINLVTAIFLLLFLFGFEVSQSANLEWKVPIHDFKFLYDTEPSGYTNYTYPGYAPLEYFRHVARVSLRGKIICAQYTMDSLRVIYPDNGRAIDDLAYSIRNRVQVLKFSPGTHSWIEWNDKQSVDSLNVVDCGIWPSTGETTYPCRAVAGPNLVIGAYVRSTGKCHAIYGDGPINLKLGEYDKFEVMTENFFGVVRRYAEKLP